MQLHPETAELTTRLSLFELVKKKRKCLSKKRSEGARHEGGRIRCFKFVYLVWVVSESERLLDRTAIQKCVQRTRKF